MNSSLSSDGFRVHDGHSECSGGSEEKNVSLSVCDEAALMM
jgi:hypothetical protein